MSWLWFATWTKNLELQTKQPSIHQLWINEPLTKQKPDWLNYNYIIKSLSLLLCNNEYLKCFWFSKIQQKINGFTWNKLMRIVCFCLYTRCFILCVGRHLPSLSFHAWILCNLINVNKCFSRFNFALAVNYLENLFGLQVQKR